MDYWVWQIYLDIQPYLLFFLFTFFGFFIHPFWVTNTFWHINSCVVFIIITQNLAEARFCSYSLSIYCNEKYESSQNYYISLHQYTIYFCYLKMKSFLSFHKLNCILIQLPGFSRYKYYSTPPGLGGKKNFFYICPLLQS